jgi:hypothetical protein
MGIFRSTDPTTWDDVDGIIINESAPAPNVQGVPANIAIIVGQTERGPVELTEVGSIGEFFELYGKDQSRGVNKALRNKKFGRLRVIRAVAAAADTAEQTFDDGGGTPVDIIKFVAKQGVGAYGNNIQVKIEAGSSSGKKYTIKDTTPGTVMVQEVYDNVAIASVVSSAVFAGSLLVTAEVLATSAEPANVAFTALAGGTDGSIADADYQTAIAKAAVEGAGNFIFLDAYNDTRNGYLKTHVADNPDKMAILCGQEGDSVSAAITDVADYRDTEGRLIYAYPYLQTSFDGVLEYVPPASFYASILSQTAPNIDPAFTANAQFLSGVTGMKVQLSRANYVQLQAAGISAFEFDSDVGFKIKSGIVTQIANSSKLTVLRRRMADFLTNSAGRFLKNYQNAVNSKENRTLVKGALMGFVTSLENDGILPKDSEVQGGKAKLIDTESQNTNSSIAAGFFKILWRQRIYSSMRYIVLSAEIGESVVVTEV